MLKIKSTVESCFNIIIEAGKKKTGQISLRMRMVNVQSQQLTDTLWILLIEAYVRKKIKENQLTSIKLITKNDGFLNCK